MTNGRLAQLVEHLVYTERVIGSSPIPSTSSERTVENKKGLEGNAIRHSPGFSIRKSSPIPSINKIMKSNNYKKGFTLIELLVVIAIIGTLSAVVLVVLNKARGKAYVASTATTQRELQKAIELYYSDMGFYPPDVGRGWDPGLFKPLPYNLDNGKDCNINGADCPVCSNCSSDWIASVQNNWNGPYVGLWPTNTPWGGEYDFNYWPTINYRYGCIIPAGIYLGAQGDYGNSHTIPVEAEQELLNKGLDNDGCLNGESQILLGNL